MSGFETAGKPCCGRLLLIWCSKHCSNSAWLFCKTSSGARLCWELEEPKGPAAISYQPSGAAPKTPFRSMALRMHRRLPAPFTDIPGSRYVAWPAAHNPAALQRQMGSWDGSFPSEHTARGHLQRLLLLRGGAVRGREERASQEECERSTPHTRHRGQAWQGLERRNRRFGTGIIRSWPHPIAPRTSEREPRPRVIFYTPCQGGFPKNTPCPCPV